jgi:PAS domain S-box-containing protein
MTPANAKPAMTRSSVPGPIGPAEKTFEAFLNSLTDGFVALDAECKVYYANTEMARLFGLSRDAMMGLVPGELFPGDEGGEIRRELERACSDRSAADFDCYYSPWQRWIHFKARPLGNSGACIVVEDISRRKQAEKERSEALIREREARDEAETLNEVSRAMAAERDLQKLVQLITDAATRLSGASFGSFFYNVTNDEGESYLLYTLSGAPRSAFEKFGLPRNTPVFEPTFRGRGIVRSDDIRKDPRYGQMSPHHGMPKGHLPVCSYLAAPVIARSGEVLGGLFFGHPEPGKFTERSEQLIGGIAAHAAVAIENAREFEKRRRTEDLLRQSEQRLRVMIDALPAAIYMTDAEGRVTHFNDAAVKLAGRVPQIGEDRWCVTWKLFLPDGTPVPKGECPMAMAFSGASDTRGIECMAERPDGSRFWFTPFPTVLRDSEGRITGGVNMLLEITERKKAEEARYLLGAIVDSSDDAIISKDLNGVITSWNQSAQRVFGYRADEAIGKTVAALLIPDDRQDEEPDILARLRRDERVDHFETVRRRKDGKLLDISLTISPVKDPKGRIVGASKIARDISERRRSERAIEDLNRQLTADLAAMTRLQRLSTRLLESQDVTKLLSEILAAAIATTAAEMGNIQLLEEGHLVTAARQGYAEDFQEFFRKVPYGVAAWGKSLQTAARTVVEDVAASDLFDDSARQAMLDAGALAVQSTPLVSRSGKVLGVFSTHYRNAGEIPERDLRWIDLLARQAADLIEQRRALEALVESEARFRQLADAMPQMVWTAGPEGSVDYYNERWYQFTGLDRDDPSDSFLTILHPDDVERCRALWDQCVRSGEPYEIEYRFRDRRENRWCWFMGRALPVRDSWGRIVKWFGTWTDIDDHKRVEDELRRANQDLEQFAYSASHDLQEPLRTIKIYSELLAARHASVLSGEGGQFLDYLRRAATRMEMLLQDLLAYTQVSKLPLAVEYVDANEVLASTLADLGGAIRQSGAAISFDKLPSLRVHWAHLKQLLQNLIGNAIKYRSPDRALVIQISAEPQVDSWVLTIRDNGIGIEPEYKERIFGLFERLYNSDQYAGTGIGLAICQRIVERYRGRIWVESEPGRGSAFSFSLAA